MVPVQAGGTSDTVTRAFQAAVEENDILDQPINVINVGGHYSIGSRRVLEAEPDGDEFLGADPAGRRAGSAELSFGRWR